MKNSKLANIQKGTLVQLQLGSSERYRVIGDNGKLKGKIAVMPLHKQFLNNRFENPSMSYFPEDMNFYHG